MIKYVEFILPFCVIFFLVWYSGKIFILSDIYKAIALAAFIATLLRATEIVSRKVRSVSRVLQLAVYGGGLVSIAALIILVAPAWEFEDTTVLMVICFPAFMTGVSYLFEFRKETKR